MRERLVEKDLVKEHSQNARRLNIAEYCVWVRWNTSAMAVVFPKHVADLAEPNGGTEHRAA